MTADLLAFLNDSPTPFHAVDQAAKRLAAAGFRPLDEAEAWTDLAPGGYYVTSSETNLIAFVLPPAEIKPTCDEGYAAVLELREALN